MQDNNEHKTRQQQAATGRRYVGRKWSVRIIATLLGCLLYLTKTYFYLRTARARGERTIHFIPYRYPPTPTSFLERLQSSRIRVPAEHAQKWCSIIFLNTASERELNFNDIIIWYNAPASQPACCQTTSKEGLWRIHNRLLITYGSSNSPWVPYKTPRTS